MTNKSRARHGIRRSQKFKLNPTTRAIRNIFALGLALTTSGPVLAGTCDVSNPTSATCDGIFAGVSISYAIDDLTIVVGGDLDTVITPIDGLSGIGLYAALGSISLTSAADIVSSGAAAISVYAPHGDVSVTNSGDLLATYGNGIEAASYDGDVTVVNEGSVLAYGARGILARSGTGDTTVENAESASVSAVNAYGGATGIAAYSYYGDVTVVNGGAIDAVATYGTATGIQASSFMGDVSVTVAEAGSVSADSSGYGAKAIGVSARSSIGGSSVHNYGDIDANAQAEYGYATSYGVLNRGGYYGITSTINDGTIDSTASTGDGVGWAWGIRTRGTDAEVENNGQINANGSAESGYATATGVYVRGMYSHASNDGDIRSTATITSGYGTARAYGAMTFGYYSSLDNAGSINAYAQTGEGTSVAFGSLSYYSIDSTTSNTGSMHADAYTGYGVSDAFGVRTNGENSAAVYNGGSISAKAASREGYAFAYGVWTDGNYLATLDNQGSISAEGTVHDGSADIGDYGALVRTRGVTVEAVYGSAYLTNGANGSISSDSTVFGEFGRAYAFGAVVQGESMARIVNEGSISAEAHVDAGYAITLGDLAYGGFAVNLNYGSIEAESTVLGNGYAQAIGQYAFGDVSTVVNEGSVTASAGVGYGGAAATGAKLYGAYVAAYNYGDIDATASAVVGSASADGISATGVFGSGAYTAADSSISASASVIVGTALARGVYNFAYVYNAYSTNNGSISAIATAHYGSASAAGIINLAYLYGNAATVNTGDIIASATSDGGGGAQAIGIYNSAYLYDATVINDGSIIATAVAVDGNATALGVENISLRFGVAVTINSGDISATANADGTGEAEAIGLYSYSIYSAPTISNSGSIAASASAQGRAVAVGTSARFYDGDALVENYGSISGQAVSFGGGYGAAEATGVSIDTFTGMYNLPSVTLVNHGDISATATREAYYGAAIATGVFLSSQFAAQQNEGSISAIANAYGGGAAEATGSSILGKYSVTEVNSGTVLAQASTDNAGQARAVGLVASSVYDFVDIRNYGDITVESTSGASESGYGGFASAVAISGSGDSGAYVYNGQAISADASAQYGRAIAQGISFQGKYGSAILVNNGDILVSSYAADASSVGTRASSKYGGSTVNTGLISAVAYAGSEGRAQALGSFTRAPGSHGYFPYSIGAELLNHGDITAIARADAGQAIAVGSRSEGASDAGATSYNAGSISAEATAAGGSAFATGAITWSYFGEVALTNPGNINAYAFGGIDGQAVATGATVRAQGTSPSPYAGSALLENLGDISALAVTSGEGVSFAIAATVTGEQGATIDNGGVLAATASGGVAQAAGLSVISTSGDVSVLNDGSISAVANGGEGSTAIAVQMTSSGSNTLTNNGSITSTGAGSAHIAIVSSPYGVAHVYNFGTIRGSILTGELDDTLVNHAGASIWLNNDIIDLGGYGEQGNMFDNQGSLVVRGANNAIDMGLNAVPLSSSNPLAFTNDGVIDFLDGAADDVLSVAGDFAGDGELRMDVSGLHGSSDRLYIDGNVVDGTHQVINLAVRDLPTTASSAITLVSVAGDSSAGDFVLGHVGFASNASFIKIDFNLLSTIDTTNMQDDVFALGMEVTGLNDSGALAASVAPGAQSLLNTQVGTWRQRLGVIDKAAKGGLSLWARLFQAKGSISPDHDAENFGQGGNFGFEQKNSGIEAGADFALSDQFSVGVLLGKAEGSQHLDGAGIGSSTIKGDSYGVYATWLDPRGFYIDGSYRWMGFTANMASASGAVEADGDAGTFNLEAGVAFTLAGGLKLEPQVQFTHTSVTDVDAMTVGATELRVADGDASTARAGLMLRKAITGASGNTVWTPYATISAVHELDGDNGYSINGDFNGVSSTGGTSALLEGGFNVQTGGLSVYGGVNWQDGGALNSFLGGQVGLRYTW